MQHGVKLHRDFDRHAFAAAAQDIGTLLRRSEIAVAGPSCRPGSQPILEDDLVAFNGINHDCICETDTLAYGYVDLHPDACYKCEDNRDHSCEPFVIDVREGGLHPDRWNGEWYSFSFKTRWYPYDRAVMLAMLALKHHLGDSVAMDSIGGWYAFNEQGRRIRTPGSRLFGKRQPSAVQIYEHVFPDRAPVQCVVEN